MGIYVYECYAYDVCMFSVLRLIWTLPLCTKDEDGIVYYGNLYTSSKVTNDRLSIFLCIDPMIETVVQ
jgi:hypothetical protein